MGQYDVVIIGAGPAGCAAGLYAARAKLKTLVVEKVGSGGQLLNYSRVENYPGFPEGIDAFELADRFYKQMGLFGVEVLNGKVIKLENLREKMKRVVTDAAVLQTKTVIVATGASPRLLGVKGEKEYTGRGVSYCAVCDAPFYRDRDVLVVGGGDSALEEALYLTRFAKRVYVVHRRDKFRGTKILQDRIFDNPKIEVILNTVVTEIVGGSGGVEKVILFDKSDNRDLEIHISGVFVFVGMNPNVGFLSEEIKCSEDGFIITNEAMETSLKGVFAAGDVRLKPLRQIVTAVGDGAVAAYSAHQYIEHSM